MLVAGTLLLAAALLDVTRLDEPVAVLEEATITLLEEPPLCADTAADDEDDTTARELELPARLLDPVRLELPATLLPAALLLPAAALLDVVPPLDAPPWRQRPSTHAAPVTQSSEVVQLLPTSNVLHPLVPTNATSTIAAARVLAMRQTRQCQAYASRPTFPPGKGITPWVQWARP